VKRAFRWAIGKDGLLYWYEGGRYLADSPQGGLLSQLVVQRMRVFGVDSILEDEFFQKIRNHLARNSPELWVQPPDDRVCLENGILHLPTLTLGPHEENWFSTVRLAAKWNPEARGEGWKGFLTKLFKEDSIEFAGEVVGGCLTPDRSVQSALWLKGTGSNGKSTLMIAIERLLGKENVVNFDISRLDSCPFTSAEFYGKLLAVDLDTKDFKMENAHTFKKLIAGDPIMAQRKFGHPFEFTAPCKMVYCGNSLPRSRDHSFGFSRRFTIVPMLNRFEPEVEGFEKQQDILARLSDAEEKSWMLLEAAKGWRRLRERGMYSAPEGVAKATEGFRLKQHPFGLWSKQNLVEAEGMELGKDEALRKLNRWLGANGHAEVDRTILGRLMTAFHPEVGERRGEDGMRWTGVGIG
jgi:putative DNA primase/helicase